MAAGTLPASQWSPAYFLRNVHGNEVRTERLPVSASQTIYKNQILVLSSGKLIQAITDSLTASQGIQSGDLSALTLFVAMNDISTTSSVTEADTLEVAPLKGYGNQILLQAANFPGSAGALGSATATNTDDLNHETLYLLGLYNNAGSLQYGVDTTTTSGCIKIKADWPGNQPTDTYARFWCGQD